MTDLLDRVDAGVDEAPPDRVRRPVARSAGSWRLAARLARRDVRRRPGRTLLVVLLIMMPTAAMTIGSVLQRSDAFGGSSIGDVTAGDGEFVVAVYGTSTEEFPVGAGGTPALGTESAEVLAAIERVEELVDDQAETTSALVVWSPIVAEAGDPEYVAFVDHLDDRLPDTVEVDDGRAPVGRDEVFLTRPLAESLEVGVGDRVSLIEPEASWTVVGVGRSTSWFDERTLIVGELDLDDVRPGWLQGRVGIDLPDGTLDAADPRRAEVIASFAALGESGAVSLGVEPRTDAARDWLGWPRADDDVRALAWGWVAGVVALAGVGVVIAAAFATSARRQLRTIGQLGATGASERTVRAMLSMQGAWSGLLGGIAAVAVGLGAVLAAWSSLEEMFGRRLADPVVAPLDLVVIIATAVIVATVAARFPARTAARVPVLTALAGRRPVGSPPRRLAPIGVGLLALGLVLLIAVSVSVADGVTGGGDMIALVALAGGLCVLAGLVCAAPVVVAAIGSLGSRRRGVVLLAARGLDRHRTRSAAVVAAIAVVAALTAAGLTGLAVAESSDVADRAASPFVVVDLIEPTVYVDGADGRDGGEMLVEPVREVAVDPPAELLDRLDGVLPGSEGLPVRSVVVEAEPYDPRAGAPVPTIVIVVDDEAIADAADLAAADRETLDEVGIVSQAYFFDPTIVPPGASWFGDGPIGVLSQERQPALWADAFVTPEWVAEQGVDTVESRLLIVAPAPLDADERSAVSAIGQAYAPWGTESAFQSVLDARPPSGFDESTGETNEPYWSVSTTWASQPAPWTLIQAIALGVVFLLVVGVVAVGLGLSAAEGRDERDVLVVVGAPPSTLRRLAGAKAWLLATAGAVVGFPVGVVTVWALRQASKAEFEPSAPLPWVAAVVVVVVIPAMVAAGAWAMSSIGGRLRPVTASSLRDS